MTTRYLLDTNVVSELRKRKPHGAVVAWLTDIPEDRLFLSAVTIGELQRGVERVRDRDAGKAREIEACVDHVAHTLNIITMDAACFRESARIGNRRPGHLLEDIMIAATSRLHGLTVVTRNGRDFQGLDVPILNPFGG